MRLFWKSQLLRMEISAHEGKQFRSQADAEEYLFDRLRNYRFSVKKVADRQYAISRRAPRITSIRGGLSAVASRHRPIDNRTSDVWGKRVSVRVDIGGRRTIKKKETPQARENKALK